MLKSCPYYIRDGIFLYLCRDISLHLYNRKYMETMYSDFAPSIMDILKVHYPKATFRENYNSCKLFSDEFTWQINAGSDWGYCLLEIDYYYGDKKEHWKYNENHSFNDVLADLSTCIYEYSLKNKTPISNEMKPFFVEILEEKMKRSYSTYVVDVFRAKSGLPTLGKYMSGTIVHPLVLYKNHIFIINYFRKYGIDYIALAEKCMPLERNI